MKLLILAIASLTAACDGPPSKTADGKTCTWNRGRGSERAAGNCVKDNIMYWCMYFDGQVICSAGCGVVAEVTQ